MFHFLLERERDCVSVKQMQESLFFISLLFIVWYKLTVKGRVGVFCFLCVHEIRSGGDLWADETIAHANSLSYHRNLDLLSLVLALRSSCRPVSPSRPTLAPCFSEEQTEKPVLVRMSQCSWGAGHLPTAHSVGTDGPATLMLLSANCVPRAWQLS